MVFHLPLRRTHDCTRVPALLGQIADPVASVSADGAYGTKAVYEAAHEGGEGRAVRVLIPPGRDARLDPRPSATRRSSVEVCEVEPWMDNDLRCNWRVKSSTQ